ncbi:DUF58 domain-containing protein [Bifidobacterium xylocopae]|nr:DUF58 domain-containing protein [Bifidobacterium xylocopae]
MTAGMGAAPHPPADGQPDRFPASRLRPLGLGMAVLTATAALAYLPLGWTELLAASAAGAGLLTTALAMTCVRSGPDASLSLCKRALTVGSSTLATVTAVNNGSRRMPATLVMIRVGREHVYWELPPLGPGDKAEHRWTLHAGSRGVAPLGPVFLRRGDPFGLAATVRPLTPTIRLHVHPRTVPLPPSALGGSAEGATGGPGRSEQGRDLHSLREYRPGDDLRRLHWAGLARTGRLLVRLYESETDETLLLHLDRRRTSYADADEFELAVSILATLGLAALGRDMEAGSNPLTLADDPGWRPAGVDGWLDRCSTIVWDGDDPPGDESLRRSETILGGARTSAPSAPVMAVTGSTGSPPALIRRLDGIHRGNGRIRVLVADLHRTKTTALADGSAMHITDLSQLPRLLGGPA